MLSVETDRNENKAGYTATLVACGLAGAVLEKVTRASGQELYAEQVIQGSHMVSGTRCPVEHRGEFPDVLRGHISGLR